MIHSTITILTTTAVALHALLGCCIHHAHSCESIKTALALVVPETNDHCSQGHHLHDEVEALTEGSVDHCGHQRDGDLPHGCDEADCHYTSTQRSNDLELMLTFSKWSQTLDDATLSDTLDRLLSLHSSAETPPNPLANSGSARAITQVWRL